MNWDFQSIVYFLKVAETLNFSQAAREMYISPQAVNKQVSRLEAQIGQKLFTRTTRTVALTPVGQQLYETFLPVRQSYDNALLSLRKMLPGGERTLRIAFFAAIPKMAVVNQISNYLLWHDPALSVKLEARELNATIEQVLTGKADLGITNKHDFNHWEGVETITLAKMPAQVAISLNHPWMVKETLTEEDLLGAPILLLGDEQHKHPDSFYWKMQPVLRDHVADFTSMLAELHLARHYAVFPNMFENAPLAQLRFLDLPEHLRFMFEMVCVYRTDSPHAALLGEMKEYFETNPLEVNF